MAGPREISGDPTIAAAETAADAGAADGRTARGHAGGDERAGSGAHTQQGPGDPVSARLAIVSPSHYEILAEFGRGGLGRVLRARDRRTGRIVALKEALSHSPNLLARFAREAVVTANLQHPAIVPVYEVGRWPDGAPFYAMKLVAGRTLADVMKAATTARARLALLPHAIAIADAIAYAHGARVVHRDLKPANILIGDFGETVVIDWGLAKRLDDVVDDAPVAGETIAGDELHTVVGAVMGTPGYMAPEQARGEAIDERVDVYALGAMLYELLSAVRPFAEYARVDEILRAAAAGPPRRLVELAPELPAELIAIVERAMASDPAARYRTAAAFADDLKRFTTGQLVGAHRYSAWTLIRRWIRRHRAVVAASAIALACVAGFGAFSVARIAAARDRAERAQALAEDRLGALYLEDGRAAALAGAPDRALAYFAAAPQGPIRAFELGRALEHLDQVDAVLIGHTGPASAVAWSPDGRRVVSSGADGTVRIWDAIADRALRVLDGGKLIAWAGDGDHLIGSTNDGKLAVWSAVTGAPVAIAAMPASAGGPVDVPACLAVASDGQTFAAGGAGGTLAWWHGTAAAPLAAIVAHTDAVTAVAFSPDGALVASASKDGLAKLWRADGTPVVTLTGHRGAVTDISFAPDGAHVVTASYDGVALVWDVQTGAHTGVFPRGSALSSARFDPSGSRVVTASADGTVDVWNVGTHESLVTIPIGVPVLESAWSRDGAWIAARLEDGTIRLFDGATYALAATLVGHVGAVSQIAFSPDGRRLASAGLDHDVRLWRVERNRAVLPLATPPGRAWRAALSPDGALVAITGEDGAARVFSTAPGSSGQALHILRHTGEVTGVSFAEDGVHVATSAGDGTAAIWDVTTGARQHTLRGGTPRVRSLAFAPGGAVLATAEGDGAARIWDAQTGALRATVRDAAGAVRAVQWSPDGARFVTEHVGKAAVVWDAVGTRVVTIATDDEVYSTAWSPDGAHLAIGTGSNHVGIYDARTGAREHDLVGHASGPISSVAFSPDGTTLLSSGSDGTARTWSVATGEARLTVGSARARAPTATWRPDGAMFATANGTDAQIWDAHSGAELARLPGLDNVAAVLWSRDGARVVVTAIDGPPRVWQLAPYAGSEAALAAIMRCRVPWRLEGFAVVPAMTDPTACRAVSR